MNELSQHVMELQGVISELKCTKTLTPTSVDKIQKATDGLVQILDDNNQLTDLSKQVMKGTFIQLQLIILSLV